jgi:hypothetical protein
MSFCFQEIKKSIRLKFIHLFPQQSESMLKIIPVSSRYSVVA